MSVPDCTYCHIALDSISERAHPAHKPSRALIGVDCTPRLENGSRSRCNCGSPGLLWPGMTASTAMMPRT